MEANLLGADKPSGVFLDSCNHHCGAWGITIDGQPTQLAHMSWYNSLGVAGAKKEWTNHTVDFPCTACCKVGA